MTRCAICHGMFEGGEKVLRVETVLPPTLDGVVKTTGWTPVDAELIHLDCVGGRS